MFDYTDGVQDIYETNNKLCLIVIQKPNHQDNSG